MVVTPPSHVVDPLMLLPHWLGWLRPHTSPLEHVPQPPAIKPPQPSPTLVPQLKPSCAQVLGTQVGAPHLLGVPPPPQVPLAQVPQPGLLLASLATPPQPSPAVPQLRPSCAQVFGTQAAEPHWPATPPPPQVPLAQLPQFELPIASLA